MSKSNTTTVTYSAMSTFLACQFRYYLRYVLGLVKKYPDDNPPLFFGSLIHNCLEVWYKTGDQKKALAVVGLVCDATTAQAYAVITGYTTFYPTEVFNILDVEKVSCNLNFTIRGNKYQIATKKDGIVSHPDYGNTLLEHKTTSDLSVSYLERVWSDFQIQLYCLEDPRDINAVLYNVVKKTQKRIRKNQTIQEYCDILTEIYSTGEMFHREEVIFTQEDLERTYHRVEKILNGIDMAQTTGYIQNPRECYSFFGRVCPYLNLCKSSGPHELNEIVKNTQYEYREPHEELRR